MDDETAQLLRDLPKHQARIMQAIDRLTGQLDLQSLQLFTFYKGLLDFSDTCAAIVAAMDNYMSPDEDKRAEGVRSLLELMKEEELWAQLPDEPLPVGDEPAFRARLLQLLSLYRHHDH